MADDFRVTPLALPAATCQATLGEAIWLCKKAGPRLSKPVQHLGVMTASHTALSPAWLAVLLVGMR